MRRLAAGLVLGLLSAGVHARAADAPSAAPPPAVRGVPAAVPQPAPPVMPAADRFEPPIAVPDPSPPPLVPDPHCPGVERLALDAGWPADPAVLSVLDLIVFRESTCRPGAINEADPGSLGSIGLAQISSATWCDSTRWHPGGYMQGVGLISSCADLLDPLTNLRAALIVWQRAGGFSPWSTAP